MDNWKKNALEHHDFSRWESTQGTPPEERWRREDEAMTDDILSRYPNLEKGKTNMAGFMLVHGNCVACTSVISFNPEKVPSLVVDGRRQPLCRSCHKRWNEIHRGSKGLPDIEIQEGAYEPQEVD